MYLVHKIYRTVGSTKLIFGIYKYQPASVGYLRAAFEKSQSITLHNGVVFGTYKPLGYYLLFRDIFVVPSELRLGRGGNYRCGELLVFTHTVGYRYSRDSLSTGFVVSPRTAAQVPAYYHLYGEPFAHYAAGNHRVGCGTLPVGADVFGLVQELGCYLVQYLSFERYSARHHHVESRNPIGSNHNQLFAADGIDIAYFTVVHGSLVGETIRSFYQCVHFVYEIDNHCFLAVIA